MLKIGEFARLFNVSLKTIRFYEEKDLLRPAYIDKFSGYRYYDNDNIETMKKILYLKDLGFSLDEIKNYNSEIVHDKIEAYKKTIEKLTANISILEERILVDNRNLQLETAREEYIKEIRSFYKNKGGLKMIGENENIYEILSKNEGLSLGKDIYLPLDKRENINCLVIGGGGSGTSAAFMMPNILSTLGSYVVIDSIGELYEKTSEYMKSKGYIVKTINYKDNPDNYNYDPINHLKTNKDVEDLANIIIGDNNNNDPFWDDTAKILIKTAIYYLLEKEEKKDLLSLYYLISEERDTFFEKIDELEKKSYGYGYGRLIKHLPEKTYKSIATTALVKLAFIINRNTENIEYNEIFDFEELYNKKVIFYINLDIMNSNDNSKIANIFLSQLLAQLDIKDNIKENLIIMLDSMASMGKINSFPKNVMTARARKISINIISNTFKELENIYGDETYTMLNYIDTQLLFGTNIESDCEYFSKISEIDKNEIKALDKDKVIIFEKGLNAIIADKNYWYNNEEWRAIDE